MRLCALAFVLAVSAPAFARSEKTLAYQREPAFATAVRFIRVDERLKMIEKDSDAGYVLFEFREEKKTFRGSLEVIEVVRDGHHQVRFVIAIEDRPSWVEIEMLGRLERKLRAELGSPAPVPAPKKDPEAPKDKEPAKPEPPKDEGPHISPTP
ncbi:MAG: hypothetical protein JWO36_3585 [Myxococcales bacterium]|nr:hypothetical protein [Myxococcales bacterium]